MTAAPNLTPNAAPDVTMLAHGRVQLALHELTTPAAAEPGAPGHESDHPLLLLHGLGEASPDAVPFDLVGWNGPVYALDFTGHGASTVPVGGGYTAEVLMADADAALAHIGPSTVYGRGLGGYVALLIAGARPALVRGAIIDNGPGLSGGGTSSHSTHIQFVLGDSPLRSAPDPFVLIEMASDIRPVDYAASFVQAAVHGSTLTPAITVVARGRAPWLTGALEQYGAEAMALTEALAVFGAA